MLIETLNIISIKLSPWAVDNENGSVTESNHDSRLIKSDFKRRCLPVQAALSRAYQIHPVFTCLWYRSMCDHSCFLFLLWNYRNVYEARSRVFNNLFKIWVYSPAFFMKRYSQLCRGSLSQRACNQKHLKNLRDQQSQWLWIELIDPFELVIKPNA